MADASPIQGLASWWGWPWSTGGSGGVPSFVPQSLTQPINPGWTFGNVITVNSVNSSAPEVEREVLSRHSYGRQIGRLMDAVGVLADALPATASNERIKAFRELAAKVEKIKKEMAPQRLEQLRQELVQLRETNRAEWEKLRDLLP